MEVLMYGNRKTDALFWMADTPERLSAAYKELFIELESWQVLDPECLEDKAQINLYNQAKAGDEKAMIKLLHLVKGGEYAEWDFIEVDDPLATADKEG